MYVGYFYTLLFIYMYSLPCKCAVHAINYFIYYVSVHLLYEILCFKVQCFSNRVYMICIISLTSIFKNNICTRFELFCKTEPNRQMACNTMAMKCYIILYGVDYEKVAVFAVIKGTYIMPKSIRAI